MKWISIAAAGVLMGGCSFLLPKPIEKKVLVPKLVKAELPPEPKECRPHAPKFPSLGEPNKGTLSLKGMVSKWRGARKQYNNVVSEKRVCSVYVKGLHGKRRPITKDKTS